MLHEVYGEDTKEEVVLEHKIELKSSGNPCWKVRLKGTDEGWNLLCTLTKDGKLARYEAVNSRFGLSLGERGVINIGKTIV